MTVVNWQLMDSYKPKVDNLGMDEQPKLDTLNERMNALYLFMKRKHGMSYAALADSMNKWAEEKGYTNFHITSQGIHKWTDKGSIKPFMLTYAAEYFGVNASWLMFNEGPPPVEPNPQISKAAQQEQTSRAQTWPLGGVQNVMNQEWKIRDGNAKQERERIGDKIAPKRKTGRRANAK